MNTSQKKITLFFYIVIALIIPILLSSIFLFLWGGAEYNISSIMPTWNDETFYYQQIKSMLTYGQPLGYFGYSGSHAPVGHFGAHGWFILLPYAIFTKIFGLHYNSVAVCNHIMFSIAILTYALLFKPTVKRTLAFAICLFSPFVLFYNNTFMMEGENYFIAVITSVLMAYLVKNKNITKKKQIIKVILGILIVFAMLSKVTWSLLLLPYILILLEDIPQLKVLWKWTFAFAATLLGTIFSYLFYSLFTADYFAGDYMISKYKIILEENNLIDAFIRIVQTFFNEFSHTYSLYENGWMRIGQVYILASLIATIVFLVITIRQNKNCLLAVIPFIIMVGSLIGTTGLYAYNIRTLHPFAIFSIAYMLILLPDLHIPRIQFIFYCILILFILKSLNLQKEHIFPKREIYLSENEETYAEITDFMSKITVDPSADTPWENTLVIPLDAHPGMLFELFLPTGLGINYYQSISDYINQSEAKWLLYNGSPEYTDMLSENGYILIGDCPGASLWQKQ